MKIEAKGDPRWHTLRQDRPLFLGGIDGRPLPADERANDLVHWQTTVRVTDLEAASRSARSSGMGWLSPAGRWRWHEPTGPRS